MHLHKWIIEGAICYIELACVVPLSGGETVYIKVLIFISEAVNNCVSLRQGSAIGAHSSTPGCEHW